METRVDKKLISSWALRRRLVTDSRQLLTQLRELSSSSLFDHQARTPPNTANPHRPASLRPDDDVLSASTAATPILDLVVVVVVVVVVVKC